MTIRIVIHQAEEGGYWTEAPVIPSRASQGDMMDELLANIRDVIEGCLSVDVASPAPGGTKAMLDLAI